MASGYKYEHDRPCKREAKNGNIRQKLDKLLSSDASQKPYMTVRIFSNKLQNDAGLNEYDEKHVALYDDHKRSKPKY